MNLSDFDRYVVPPELIAQMPADPRDSSRLMVLRRATGAIEHHVFRDLPDLLDETYTLVLNNSKVVKARLDGARPDGSAQTIYLLKQEGPAVWRCVGDGIEAMPEGEPLKLTGSPIVATLMQLDPDGTALFSFAGAEDLHAALEAVGRVPLPPYITETAGEARYQTVYAKEDGSVAAPTAGLHFTDEVFARLDDRGVRREEVTLHVGYGTFAHVHHEDLGQHPMHAEPFTLPEATAARLNADKAAGKKLLTVGTTATRVIESRAGEGGVLMPGTGETNLFIYPPYRFKAVDALLTNFHMPGLTPIMLVAAFAGYELTMRAYETAIAERYRFYSFGDSMLVL